jgi:hypothetical protein
MIGGSFKPTLGTSYVTPGITAKTMYSNSQYGLTAVSKSNLKTFIHPLKYNLRRARNLAARTALANAANNFNVTSDASGNVGVYVFPQNVASSSVSSFAAWAY